MSDCPSPPQHAFIHELSSTPVMGVSLGNVSLLRLDQGGGPAPGNKSFKLSQFLCEARQSGVNRLVSFGGIWSNHLHALAAAGAACGVETVGLVRGAGESVDSGMLADVRRWGMQVVPVSRADYRRRHDADYQQQLVDHFAPCLLIPEGGAAVAGARGCVAIARLIQQHATSARQIVLPVGTGATLAGVVAGLDRGYEVLGISALKGATDLEQRVAALLEEMEVLAPARWRILHEYHCGGFARTHAALREFMQTFESVNKLQLEPVYTGKMLFAIHQLRATGQWDPRTPVLAVHTGGLQGRRGYQWLD